GGRAAHVDAARVGQAHLINGIAAAPAEVSREAETKAAGEHLTHESVLRAAARSRLYGVQCGEVVRSSEATHVGVSVRVYGNAVGPIRAAPAQVGGIGQREPGAHHLRHETVAVVAHTAAVDGLESVRYGEVRRERLSGE